MSSYTYRNLQDQVYEQLSINSDDTNVSRIFIADVIDDFRALFLRNEYNRKRTIDEDVIQYIKNIPLEDVNSITLCNELCIPQSNCLLKRTAFKIPATIELHNSNGILRIAPVDIIAPMFERIELNEVETAGNNRSSKKALFTFEREGYIYVYSKNLLYSALSFIEIAGVFEDTSNSVLWRDCGKEEGCFNYDKPYPLNRWMWSSIKDAVINKVFEKMLKPEDEQNNNQEIKFNQQTPQ